MSQSIGIPGFISERKTDILKLATFSGTRKNVSNKRQRITMYRTRSFMRRCMSRTVKLKRARSQPFNVSSSARRKQLFRRQRRRPAVLQDTLTLTGGECVPANDEASVTVTPETAIPSGESECGVARLSTHIWHSKRFFMSPCRAWIIPRQLHNRGLKAVDGLLEGCALQDVSYQTGLVRSVITASSYTHSHSNGHDGNTTSKVFSLCLHGTVQHLHELLRRFTDPHLELFATSEHEGAQQVIPCEVDTLFYQREMFPAGCIGPVSLLSAPIAQDNSENIQALVMCHPSIAEAVYSQLSTDEGDWRVQLTPLRLNRFRLRGETASKALLSLLGSAEDGSAAAGPDGAVLQYLRAVLATKSVSKHIQDGEVVSVAVQDPREATTHASNSKTASAPTQGTKALNKRPANLCTDTTLLTGVRRVGFRKDHVLNAEKHDKKVRDWEGLFATATPFPDTALKGVNDSHVKAPATCPLLLIRKESHVRRFHTRNHQLQGWDVLVPAEWGPTVFRALQVAGGAIAVGFEEMDHLQANAGVVTFPRDFVDTAAGREYWSERHLTAEAENAKRPPQKRVLNRSLEELLLLASNQRTDAEDATIGADRMLVVRGDAYLRDFLPPQYEDISRADIVKAREEIAAHQDEQGYVWDSPHVPALPALPPMMFLQVLLVPVGRGLAHDLAEIIMPTVDDVELFVSHKDAFREKRAKKRATKDGYDEEFRHVKAAAHHGLYGHANSSTGTDSACTHAGEGGGLSKEWAGVKLSRQRRVPGRTVATASPTSAMEVDGDAGDAGDAADPAHGDVAAPGAGRVYYDFEIGLELGRRVIGTVTSGQQPHLNNTHFAVGLCNVNALNELFRRSFGRFPHPQAHLMVLVRNARSDWLRPALLQVI